LVDSERMEILRARENIYSFLSRIYRSEVSSEFLQNLYSGLAHREDLDDGYALLQKFIDSARGSDPHILVNQLAVEYARLFLNAGDPPHVFPYESVYTSAYGLLMQEARDQVLKAYRMEGLDRDADFKEPEDHIAIELEFMAHLCRNAAEALEGGDIGKAHACIAKQRDFLETHLLKWIPRFCDELEPITRSDFYRAVAQITRHLLAVELETIDEIAGATGEADGDATKAGQD
jgi:TorA maturation chaperone TorD